jgi:hypothetical protein
MTAMRTTQIVSAIEIRVEALGAYTHIASRRPGRSYRSDRDRYTSRADQYYPRHLLRPTLLTIPRPAPSGAKIRVDNLHYDLTEDDIKVCRDMIPMLRGHLLSIA